MAGKVHIIYFLEDIAHEKFIRGLVARIATQLGLSEDSLIEDVRNAAGGSRTLRELRRFLADVGAAGSCSNQILLVAKDGNGAQYTRVSKDIAVILKSAGYQGPAVLAVPNPYIERWYVIDTKAFQLATGAPVTSRLPRGHHPRGYYKMILRDALLAVGIRPVLGGAEYGEEVAKQVNLYQAGKADASFRRFVDDLTREIRGLMA
ncbi:MAG: hypothetical protein HYX92_04620 [Chloroflexi bacterium]|nr:hypothetical protein [Chloroflexota bacterium]